MSQDAFAALLAVIFFLAVVAIQAYVVASSTDRLLRGVASLGLTEVPWWLLRAPHGRHVRPRGYVDPVAPTVYAWGVDMAFPDADPIAVAIDEQGLVHVVHRDGEHYVNEDAVDALIYALQAVYAPVPDLKVRAAELLAHEENEDRVPVPARTDAGATEDWSALAEVTAMRIPPVIHRTAPDDDEVRILAELAAVVDDLAEVPDWAVEWGKETDAYLKAAGLDAEAHKRWRAGTLDVPTGEWRMVLQGQH